MGIDLRLWGIRFEYVLRALRRRSGFWTRLLLSWMIGLVALSNDELSSYDLRLNLRDNQKISSQVVQILLKKEDLVLFNKNISPKFWEYAEFNTINDSLYWNQKIWSQLLNKILNQNPHKIAVTLYFGNNIGPVQLNNADKSIFFDPRIIWATSVNGSDDILNPKFSLKNNQNIGKGELHHDDDGVVRRFYQTNGETPHIIESLTSKKISGFIINYRGNKNLFNSYSLSEILQNDFNTNIFNNKYVIIGIDKENSASVATPIGKMSRSEIISHLTDNIVENRIIFKFPPFVYYFLFLLISLLTVYIISTYPQSVALFIIFWMATLIAALSAWIFDTFYIWIPAFSPFLLLATTWIIFIGHHANSIERKNFELQQEQKYLQQLEQLKNNFISLISHDLKTPIAKIQAVVDRMIIQHHEPEIQSDLKHLLKINEELNRYIQSILKVLRVESRDFKLHKEIADINETIDDVVQSLTPLAKEKNIQIQKQLEPLFSIEYDVTLIKEVIQNIIENAIKYSNAGGEIFITSQESDNYIWVKIKDTGSGIRPDDLTKVWSKFTRGSEQDMKTKGTGLGLYLVKYFIELHGGSVDLQSELHKGTCITFTLPVNNDELA